MIPQPVCSFRALKMESVCSRSDRSAVELARAGSILFLGYHVALQLGRHGIEVVNVDNLTPFFMIQH